MIEVTIIRRADQEWSSITIGQKSAFIVSGTLTTDTDTDTAWQLISYATFRPNDFTVTYDGELRQEA